MKSWEDSKAIENLKRIIKKQAKLEPLRRKIDRYVQNLLEKLGFKPGQVISEEGLIEALMKYHGAKWIIVKGHRFVPDEIIDDLNLIADSRIVKVITFYQYLGESEQ